MFRVTYRSSVYRTCDVMARYVMATFDTSRFAWCEVDGNRRDIRQGECDASDVPDAIRAQCERLRGEAFAYVRVHQWPEMEGYP